jgi:hypothetical protein
MDFIIQCLFVSSITKRLEENESLSSVGNSKAWGLEIVLVYRIRNYKKERSVHLRNNYQHKNRPFLFSLDMGR